MSSYAKGYQSDQDLSNLLLSDLDYHPDTGHVYWNKQTVKRVLNKPVGTNHSSGYLLMSTGVNGKVYSLRVHRVVWLLAYGEWPEGFVDHINNDRTDNRFSNLRLATTNQNSRNCVMHATNKSGYRGVSWAKHRSKWVARIGLGDRGHKFLGYYDCPIEAAKVYDAESLKHHGDYGKRNFDDS